MSRITSRGSSIKVKSTDITHGTKILSDILNNLSMNLDNKDLNTLTGKLIFGYGNGCVNRPSGAMNGYFINIPHYASGYDKQIFMPRTPQVIYVRNNENNTFGDWTTIS